MLNKNLLMGVLALALIFGLMIVGCGDGNGGGNDNQPVFSVSGEFQGAKNGNALFKAATTETARSVNDSYELTGELEDGDMLFRLRGTYDASTGNYTVSSASSFARYTINGNKNSATATLAVLDGEEWKSFIVSVTLKEVIVKDGDAEDYEGGLPAWAQGSWHDWWTEKQDDLGYSSFEAWSYFDKWYYQSYRWGVWKGNYEYSVTRYSVISAEALDNDVYDVIFSYPVYIATDVQKKAAVEKFFADNNHSAKFWNKPFEPWNTDVWNVKENSTLPEHAGKDFDNSVIWYICLNEAHEYTNAVKIINWDTFTTLVPNEDDWDEMWEAPWSEENFEDKRLAVVNFFDEKNISNFYYWGWHEPGYDGNQDHLTRTYSCWAPACEGDGMGSWWKETHYYLLWGNQVGIQGDWDLHGDLFIKWSTDDSLITYLRSQNVEPETWYTRVRIWKNNDTFMFFYYNGDNEAQNSHPAPACDTQSLTKIQSLTDFDPATYPDWSYNWYSNRTSPR